MHIPITTTILAGLLLVLSGCQTQSIQQTDPPIAGQWSLPVNGVRMMAMPIADSPYVKGSRTVLIFMQNIGDKGVDLPQINPAPFVTVRPDGTQLPEQFRERPRLPGNLRIQIESAENEGIHGPSFRYDRLEKMEAQGPDLLPGEVRVFALILKTDETPIQMMQQLDQREVQTAMTQWLIHSPEPHRYRVYLSYRPDGFGPPSESRLREASETRWAGKQIDLPPFEMLVSSRNSNSQ